MPNSAEHGNLAAHQWTHQLERSRKLIATASSLSRPPALDNQGDNGSLAKKFEMISMNFHAIERRLSRLPSIENAPKRGYHVPARSVQTNRLTILVILVQACDVDPLPCVLEVLTPLDLECCRRYLLNLSP